MWKKISGLLAVSLLAAGLAACGGTDDNNRVQRNNVNNVRPLDMNDDNFYRNGRNGMIPGNGMNRDRNGTMTDMNGPNIDRNFNGNNNMNNRNGRDMRDVLDVNPLDGGNDGIVPNRMNRRMNGAGGLG